MASYGKNLSKHLWLDFGLGYWYFQWCCFRSLEYRSHSLEYSHYHSVYPYFLMREDSRVHLRSTDQKRYLLYSRDFQESYTMVRSGLRVSSKGKYCLECSKSYFAKWFLCFQKRSYWCLNSLMFHSLFMMGRAVQGVFMRANQRNSLNFCWSRHHTSALQKI